LFVVGSTIAVTVTLPYQNILVQPGSHLRSVGATPLSGTLDRKRVQGNIQSSGRHNIRQFQYNHLTLISQSVHDTNGPPVSENVILYIQTPVVSAHPEDLLPFTRSPKLQEIRRLNIGIRCLHGYLSALGSSTPSSHYLDKISLCFLHHYAQPYWLSPLHAAQKQPQSLLHPSSHGSTTYPQPATPSIEQTSLDAPPMTSSQARHARTHACKVSPRLAQE